MPGIMPVLGDMHDDAKVRAIGQLDVVLIHQRLIADDVMMAFIRCRAPEALQILHICQCSGINGHLVVTANGLGNGMVGKALQRG